jgi:hypothetical protein
MVLPKSELGKTRQPWLKEAEAVVSCKLPLEPTFPVLNVWPYTLTGNGNVIAVVQSSQWLVVSVVPGVIVFPVVVVVV